MTAPTQAGEYTSAWRMQNDKGEVFGLGANAEGIFALIRVVTGANTDTPTPENTATETSAAATTETETPTPTDTPTPTATTPSP
jgi:hypothetical protein